MNMAGNTHRQKAYLKNKKIIFFFSLLASIFSHKITACGYYLEPACSSAPVCQTSLGLTPDANDLCVLTAMSNWDQYPLDTSRGNYDGMNYWKYDDLVRDQLNMDSNQLRYQQLIFGNKNPSLELKAHDRPHDGRYIYVIRISDGKMIMRQFDRESKRSADTLFPLAVRFNYSRFRNLDNYRVQNGSNLRGTACGYPSPLLAPGDECMYLHVRHSQINGTKPAVDGSFSGSDAWNPVYCAGELRVHNGKIDRINNASGHFKPAVACLSNAITLLKALDIPISAKVKSGDYSTVDTSEVFFCSQGDSMTVPDTPDYSYHACSYNVISQSEKSEIGGVLGSPIYQGSNTCANPNAIWVWTHHYNCVGDIYSLGAEYP